jgi:hypothetical protein
MISLPRLVLTAIAAAILAPSPLCAAELIVVERTNCPVCIRWNREIAEIYPKTPEGMRAPLHRIDIADTSLLGLAAPVDFTPTFLLVNEGHEIGRITGYQNDDMFWGLFNHLVVRLDQLGRSE